MQQNDVGSDVQRAGEMPASLAPRPVSLLGITPSQGVYLWTEADFLAALATRGIAVDNRGARPMYEVRPGYSTTCGPSYLSGGMSWDERFDRLVAEQNYADVYHQAMMREAGFDIDYAERQREPTQLERFWADDRGAEAIEYAVIVGLVASGLLVVVLLIAAFVRGSLGELLRGAKAGANP